MHFENPRKWKLLRDKMDPSHTARHLFINEVLGESADAGIKLLSQSDLIAACQIYGKPNTYLEALKNKHGYLDVALGVDWGGSTAPYGAGRAHLLMSPQEAVSYTAMAIVGLKPNGKIDVLYVYRFDLIGNHLEEARALLKAWRDVDEGHRTTLFCHDYGGAGSVRETIMIQAGLPVEQVVGCQYVRAPQAKMMDYKEHGGRGYWSVDKARSLILLCQAIKAGFVGLPAWQSARARLTDFLALMEDTVERPGSSGIVRVIRKPGAPDDCAHAINFAALGLWHRHGYPNFHEIFKLEDVLQRLDQSAEAQRLDSELDLFDRS